MERDQQKQARIWRSTESKRAAGTRKPKLTLEIRKRRGCTISKTTEKEWKRKREVCVAPGSTTMESEQSAETLLFHLLWRLLDPFSYELLEPPAVLPLLRTAS